MGGLEGVPAVDRRRGSTITGGGADGGSGLEAALACALAGEALAEAAAVVADEAAGAAALRADLVEGHGADANRSLVLGQGLGLGGGGEILAEDVVEAVVEHVVHEEPPW